MKNKTRKFFFLLFFFYFFLQIQRKGSHCDGWPTQVKKKKENEGSKAHSKRWLRARRRARKEARAQRRAWENARAQRRARRETRAQRHARKRWGLEGALGREVGLRNALPWMVKGSKAHLKGDKAWRRTWKKIRAWKRSKNNAQRLEGAFEGDKARRRT